MGDAGNNPGMQSLCKTASDAYPGLYVVCANVANGIASITTPLAEQVDEFAKLVQTDPKLANGFHAVGLSQVCGRTHRPTPKAIRTCTPVCMPTHADAHANPMLTPLPIPMPAAIGRLPCRHPCSRPLPVLLCAHLPMVLAILPL